MGGVPVQQLGLVIIAAAESSMESRVNRMGRDA